MPAAGYLHGMAEPEMHVEPGPGPGSLECTTDSDRGTRVERRRSTSGGVAASACRTQTVAALSGADAGLKRSNFPAQSLATTSRAAMATMKATAMKGTKMAMKAAAVKAAAVVV